MSNLEDTRLVNRTVAYGESELTASSSQLDITDTTRALDRDWMGNAFMVADVGFGTSKESITRSSNRNYTTANMKFTDSTIGGNIGINPRPQYCRYSDVRVKGRLQRDEPGLTSYTGNHGMGRQYSEFIDDGAQRINISFGVPKFSGLLGFLTAAYESNQVTLARTGRANSLFYTIGAFIGSGAAFFAFPLLSVAFLGNKLLNYAISRPSSKFYTLKPTPHLYWSAVQNLVTAMAVNRGIVAKVLTDESGQRQGRAYKLDNTYIKNLSTLFPGVFRIEEPVKLITDLLDSEPIDQLYIDVFAISTLAARRANQVFLDEWEGTNEASITDFTGYVRKLMGDNDTHATPILNSDGTKKFGTSIDRALTVQDSIGLKFMFERIKKIPSYFSNTKDNGDIEVSPTSSVQDEKGKPVVDKAKEEEIGTLAKELDAQIRDGALFATFIVDHTGPQSEGWSNSMTDSDLANKINGKVTEVAEARFTFADGNMLGGAIGDFIGAVGGAATAAITGTLSGLTFGVSDLLHGIGSGGYIDIPKHWQSSSYKANSMNYSMKLVTPYGNAISFLINLDIPLAMIMAGGLPRSTGKSSYTSPFLCQVFDRGRCQARLAMIESINFTRGTTHLSFSDTGEAYGVDVSFSIVDLTSIMHMPIANGIFNDIDITSDPDNSLQDYLAVLAGMSTESQIYDGPRLRLRLAKTMSKISTITSSSYLASIMGNTTVGEFVKLFTRPSAVLDPTGGGVRV